MPKQPDSAAVDDRHRSSTIVGLFEHRSGRIIAVCRVVFAAVFFASLLLDPKATLSLDDPGFEFLGSYLILAICLLAVAMRSWWWDHRLAWPMLVIDILAFLTAVFLTEGTKSDFTSPFLAIFAFVMLSATIRWDWRVSAFAGIAVTSLYLLVGLGLFLAEAEIDTIRFGRRVAYMLVLSLILIWFGLQRREQHISRFRDAPIPAASPLPPLDDALAFAIAESGASAGAIAWNDNEEPAIDLRSQGLGVTPPWLSPTALPGDGAIGQRARIFSADRSRSLRASNRGRPVASAGFVDEPLADLLDVGEALAMPVTGGTGNGEIILTGITGMCEDHVAIGSLISRELEAAFNRHATLMLLHEAAIGRSREALARDLHDSVAQSLAGAALRLEGLRKSIAAGHDADAEIVQLKDAFRTEQQQVRTMIDRLRSSTDAGEHIELSASVGPLLRNLATSWAIVIPFSAPAPITVSVALEHEIGNVLREGVANAVRHGRASKVAVEIHADQRRVMIEIADDGTGFAPDTGPEAPRSIRERIRRYGGTLDVQSGWTGTRLSISLPLGETV